MTTLTDPNRQFVLAVLEAVQAARRQSPDARLVVHMNSAGIACLRKMKFRLDLDATDCLLGFVQWQEAGVRIRLIPSTDPEPVFELAEATPSAKDIRRGKGTVWSRLTQKVSFRAAIPAGTVAFSSR